MEVISKVIYINLEDDTTRKNQIENELKKHFKNEKISRFNAIRESNGAVGCTKSHIKILETAIENNWENYLVIEDDCVWFNFDYGISVLENLVKKRYDVIMLSSTNSDIDVYSYKIIKANSTCSYLVSKHYYETLLENFKEGLEKLLLTNNSQLYAIDQYFKTLQERDNWYGVYPPLFVNRPTYSKIEKCFRNYLSEGCYINYNTNFQTQISQIYLNEYDDTPSESLQNLINKIKAICKSRNWVYKLYDKTSLRDFIKENYDDKVLFAYDSLYPYSYKSDLGRFCILNKRGGWYFDISMDVVNIPRIDNKIHCLSFRDIMKKGAPWACCTGVMYSKPNNPALQKVINYIVENVNNKFYGYTPLAPTGPELLGKAFCDFGVHYGFLFGELKNLTPESEKPNNAVVDFEGNIIAFTKKCDGGDLSPYSTNRGFNNYGELWRDGLIYDGDENFGGYILKNKTKTECKKIGVFSVINTKENLEKIISFSKENNNVNILLIILDKALLQDLDINENENIEFLLPNVILQDYTEYYKLGLKKLFEEKECDLFISFNLNNNFEIATNYIEKVSKIFDKYNPRIFSGCSSKFYPSYLTSTDDKMKLLTQCEDYNIILPKSTYQEICYDEIKNNFFYQLIQRVGRIHCLNNENLVIINNNDYAIPRVIYTFQNKEVEAWRALNPSYEIKNFENDEQCFKFININEDNPNHRINLEFFKTFILCNLGGVFVNNEFSPIDLSKVINNNNITFYTDLQNSFLASVKNHPFLIFYLNLFINKVENIKNLYDIIKGILQLNSLSTGTYETFKIL